MWAEAQALQRVEPGLQSLGGMSWDAAGCLESSGVHSWTSAAAQDIVLDMRAHRCQVVAELDVSCGSDVRGHAQMFHAAQDVVLDV